jgi:hypothetical protein
MSAAQRSPKVLRRSWADAYFTLPVSGCTCTVTPAFLPISEILFPAPESRRPCPLGSATPHQADRGDPLAGLPW